MFVTSASFTMTSRCSCSFHFALLKHFISTYSSTLLFIVVIHHLKMMWALLFCFVFLMFQSTETTSPGDVCIIENRHPFLVSIPFWWEMIWNSRSLFYLRIFKPQRRKPQEWEVLLSLCVTLCFWNFLEILE